MSVAGRPIAARESSVSSSCPVGASVPEAQPHSHLACTHPYTIPALSTPPVHSPSHSPSAAAAASRRKSERKLDVQACGVNNGRYAHFKGAQALTIRIAMECHCARCYWLIPCASRRSQRNWKKKKKRHHSAADHHADRPAAHTLPLLPPVHRHTGAHTRTHVHTDGDHSALAGDACMRPRSATASPTRCDCAAASSVCAHDDSECEGQCAPRQPVAGGTLNTHLSYTPSAMHLTSLSAFPC